MAELTDTQQMSDAEGDAWDALHDDPNIICTCDGCNFYSPTYDPDGECSLTTHIKAISSVVVREHVTAALEEAAARIEGAPDFTFKRNLDRVRAADIIYRYRNEVRDYRQEQDR